MALPPNLVAKRRAALSYQIATKAKDLRLGGITVSGVPVDTGVEGMALLLGADDYFAKNPSAPPVNFVVSSTLTVQLNATQIAGMLAAVTAFIQACYTAEASLNTGYSATPSTVNSLEDITTALNTVQKAF